MSWVEGSLTKKRYSFGSVVMKLHQKSVKSLFVIKPILHEQMKTAVGPMASHGVRRLIKLRQEKKVVPRES